MAPEDRAQKAEQRPEAPGLSQLLRGSLVTQLIYVAATLGVADLGAAYLGGVRFTTLARAGRVMERTAGALARADAAFASEPSAYCSTDF